MNHRPMQPLFLVACLLLACGCQQNLRTPRAILLPEKYNSPDGMTLGRDGCIYLSINNAGEGFKFVHPGKIVRITADEKIEDVSDLPKHPDTGVVSPLGICFGSDGNLYVADNQMFASPKRGQSRLLRVNMDGGTAKSVDVVVAGINMANGVAARGDSIYLNDSTLDEASPMASGVYRFPIAELKAIEPVKVAREYDRHLIAMLKTRSAEHKVGANGLAFDSKGNLYVCNFGDRVIVKLTLDPKGNRATQAVFVNAYELQSVDGLQCDAEDNLWVADFLGNAIARISTADGTLTVIARNGPADGSDGRLHAPSECLRRGNRVYISNINITYGPHAANKIQTISVVDLDKK